MEKSIENSSLIKPAHPVFRVYYESYIEIHGEIQALEQVIKRSPHEAQSIASYQKQIQSLQSDLKKHSQDLANLTKRGTHS